MDDWNFPGYTASQESKSSLRARLDDKNLMQEGSKPKPDSKDRTQILAKVKKILNKKNPPSKADPVPEPQTTRPQTQHTTSSTQDSDSSNQRGRTPSRLASSLQSELDQQSARIDNTAKRNSRRATPKQEKGEKMWLPVYKTSKDLNKNCNGQRCRYWHSSRDRRRKTDKFGYIPELCPVVQDCPLKEYCIFSHNAVEVEFHPTRYKTLPCTDFSCPRDIHCPNKHPGETYTKAKAIEPETEMALATLNSLHQESIPQEDELESGYASSMKSQIDLLKEKLYCRSCYCDVVGVFWKPCGHAVCLKCAEANECVFDGNKHCRRLILE
mmetsp:Transcript_22343/g.40410  ORF Transcript_22343/g.40410 Transcript_22343/m.40410 type:complete len:326 (-) Transcript_22343:32-1009(-)